MYTKMFESIYDGTLSENWKALVTFQQLLVLSDADGVVDMTVPALSRRTGIPTEILDDGIRALEEPDPASRTPDLNGRRIIRLDEHREWGWSIVNYSKYRDMGDVDKVRAQNRERQARYREKIRKEEPERDENGVTENNAGNVTSRDGNAKSRHKNKNKNKKKENLILTASIDAEHDSSPDSECLLTRKRRKLAGARLEDFNKFWNAFDYKRGRAEAADAWLDIDGYSQGLVGTIVAAAKLEAKRREWILKKGQTPKMAQGWITGRRWEDSIDTDLRLESVASDRVIGDPLA